MSIPPFDPLVAAAADALLRAVPECLALVLGGSHARGEAVWVRVDGRPRCLSDLDLHAVVRDRAARERASAAAAAVRPELATRLAALGLASPVDLGIHTVEEWERTPARPATLELRRSGAALHGGTGWIERLPAWTARDVPAEEVRLLLENRAFELLAARGALAGDPAGLAALAAAHSQYKCALDLAGVERLERGAYEADAAERVRAARAAAPGRTAAGEPAWDAALGWRAGRPPEPAAWRDDWWRIAAGWEERWRRSVAPDLAARDFEAVALAAARRARLRRRVRLALRPEMGRSNAPPLAARLRHVLAGTPQHRLNASAGAAIAALVLEHAGTIPSPAARERLARVVGRLGAVPATGDPETLARSLRSAWDRWVMGETRGGGTP